MVACLCVLSFQADKGLFALGLLTSVILKTFETHVPFLTEPFLAPSSSSLSLEDMIMESVLLLLSRAMCICSPGS